MNWKWGVYMADLNPVIGSEQQGRRPVLVVSDETFNRVMPVVSVVPLTSRKPGRRVYPNEALLAQGTGGLSAESIVLAHQIRTIAKERLLTRLGEIRGTKEQEETAGALRIHLNL